MNAEFKTRLMAITDETATGSANRKLQHFWRPDILKRRSWKSYWRFLLKR
jgi:hypothetical protein